MGDARLGELVMKDQWIHKEFEGHEGTWYEISRIQTAGGELLRLMESEKWGDEAMSLVVQDDGTIIGQTYDDLITFVSYGIL